MLKYRKIYFTISGVLILASIVALIIFGLNLGIDFTGGSLMEIKDYSGTTQELKELLENQNQIVLKEIKIQPEKYDNGFLIRLPDLTEEEHQTVLKILPKQISEERFESIGPTIGKELKRKALWQIFLVAISIVFYIAWAFRKVSQIKEKSKISWKFGTVALIALLHDVIITLGIFAILGHFLSVEIDSSFVAAILLVLGYSVNDTIVVFDRLRENLIKNKYFRNLEKVVNKSIKETVVRSLNTSTTTLIVLFSILLFGGQAIFYFVLALSIGIIVGTYSSIFLASPLLWQWEK